MNDSETPETDARVQIHPEDLSCLTEPREIVSADFAREMERQRNEALKERDQARSDRDELKRRMGEGPARIQELEFERDELRAKLNEAQSDVQLLTTCKEDANEKRKQTEAKLAQVIELGNKLYQIAKCRRAWPYAAAPLLEQWQIAINQSK